MSAEIRRVDGGTVTTPRGFLAGATYAGIKTYGEDKLDLGILFSERPCTSAATFTSNRIKGGSVKVCKEHASLGRVRAVVCNSGIANTAVGEQGTKDAREVVALTARKLGIPPEEVGICSTGIIGVELPMALIRAGLPRITLTPDGGHAFARAIMTTDTRPKEVAVTFSQGDRTVTIGGVCKGAAMIHPNMATMLAFVATDAAVELAFLRQALKAAVDASFNMISVDGDTSTSDTVLCLANGAAGAPPIEAGSEAAALFQEALTAVCVHLAKEIVRDGEGSNRTITVTVEGARTLEDARKAARAIVASNLVKAAVHGGDPNWGRIVCALGYSGAEVDEERLALYVNEVCLVEEGRPIPFHKNAVVAIMRGPDVHFRLHLHLGDGAATAWGCELTEEYVTLNSAYTT